MKTKKSILKRLKITSSGKLLRRHQMGAGHLKRHKSNNALNRQKKTTEFFHGEGKKYKKVIGL